MTDAEKLCRLALLNAAIACRLYEVRTWSDQDKRDHKANVAERDAIYTSAWPAHLATLTHSRAAADLREASAPWKLRLATWLCQHI
jgi:hypothetical protein